MSLDGLWDIPRLQRLATEPVEWKIDGWYTYIINYLNIDVMKLLLNRFVLPLDAIVLQPVGLVVCLLLNKSREWEGSEPSSSAK